MNSLLLQQEAAGGVGGSHKQLESEMTTASSGASVATSERTATAAGFNMKQYEEELIKLRNDNFSLKLRIHLLEERQGTLVMTGRNDDLFHETVLLLSAGLALRPGDSDARENVFRVNLDLRVEKETMKQQIDEKNKLLAQAAGQ